MSAVKSKTTGTKAFGYVKSVYSYNPKISFCMEEGMFNNIKKFANKNKMSFAAAVRVLVRRGLEA